MNVIPTIYLDLRNPYIVVIEDWGQAMLIMPDADTDFTDYLRSGSSPLPARQLPDPAAIPDGSTVISENNVWVAGNFIYRGRTAPVHPGSDPAIWIDENQSPPGIRWWTGLAWTDQITVDHFEALTIPGTALMDMMLLQASPRLTLLLWLKPKLGNNAVIARVIAPNAVLTDKIRDGAVTEPKLADGAVSRMPKSGTLPSSQAN